MSLPVININVNYEAEKDRIRNFLSNFIGPANGDVTDGIADMDIGDEDNDPETQRTKGLKYMSQLQRIANRDQQMLVIDLEDILKHERTVSELVSRIRDNGSRYTKLFNEVVDTLMPIPTKDISEQDEVIDIIMHQRRERNDQIEGGQDGFPIHLLRRYNLYFKPLLSDISMAVREVKGIHLGKLITVRGIVTRVSEVKPLLLVNAYTCDVCGSETFQEISRKEFTPVADCQNENECLRNNIKGSLHMQTRACRFSPFQEVKIQEMADQVPVGHIPRSMTVHVNGSLTRAMNPGDTVHLGGLFLPIPYTGFQAVRAGLLTDTYLDVHHILQLKKQYSEMEVTPEMRAAIERLHDDPTVYQKLAFSIAPEIYGHVDVKKALLLLLVGGVTKSMGDGMKIRGDLNICLMGDPGVAKSQLLKYISKVAPRGVYTTGKGSSGVGLTAAVMRDPVTDEMREVRSSWPTTEYAVSTEFDKMDEADRTAIHEVMEQQTISISKAGITTTLNARTSILAAANPLYGRYNPKISPVENINLPAALLSRFDLLFLLLDKPSRDDDERLAQHVTHVHMYNKHPDLEYEPLDPALMRAYIALARQRRPIVPPDVSSYIVDSYVRLRKQSKDDAQHNRSHTHTSARTLLGVLRLAQALARLRFAAAVLHADVDEALRLMEASKESLRDDEDREGGDRDADRSDTSRIYRIIKDMAQAEAVGGGGRRATTRRRAGRLGRGPDGERDIPDEEDGALDVLSMVDIRARVLRAGYTETQLMTAVQEYEDLNIWTRVANGSKLSFA
ncbi:MCM2/3/5 family-domain-containing protein [Russula earlei]|uniref:MCM2/3/5 family-domain-containing protein n=1 Tax=Russula earlei TaxID=71964 RepID=A0ACC0UIP1_9AGAM|nr:MCM2/3/5 family-domain-containing protein [Russula earlei]